MAKTNTILVEISPGELIDKITILEIKAERIADARKLTNVRYALDRLSETGAATLAKGDALERLRAVLRTVNEALWEIRRRHPAVRGRAGFRSPVHRAGPRCLSDQ